MAALFIAAIALGTARRQATPLQPFSLPFGVSATLPAKPEEDKEGDKGSDRKSFLSVSSDALYYVSDTPVDAKEKAALPPDQQLAVYIYGALESLEGSKLTSYSDILLDGWPGVEIKVDDAKGEREIWSRVYDMNGHIIELGTIYEKDNGPSPDAATVLNSLKQDKPKYGPLTSSTIGFANVEPDGMPFHVDFPDAAKDEPQSFDADGDKITVHHYNYVRDMRLFDFSYMDLPSGYTEGMPSDGPEQIRNGALSSVMKGLHGDIDSSTTQQRDGNDWLTAQFHVKGYGVGRADVLYLNGHIFTLVAIGPEPWMDAPEFKRFFDSFEVKN
jgi:hypothetical protein